MHLYQIIVGSTELGSGLQFDVQEIVISPKYVSPWPYNDIALIFLLRPLAFGLFVQPACLPTHDLTYVGQPATVIGFGMLYYDGPLADYLQETAIQILDNRVCQAAYAERLDEGDQFFVNGISADLVCAGAPDGGADACLVNKTALLLNN